MANKERRRHVEIRKPAALYKVIGTAHGHDIVMTLARNPVPCMGVCGRRMVHSVAEVRPYGVSKGLCTAESCKHVVREKIINDVGVKIVLSKVQPETQVRSQYYDPSCAAYA
ncbi:MAG: hypothetical protein WCG01_01580 [bacterium]